MRAKTFSQATPRVANKEFVMISWRKKGGGNIQDPASNAALFAYERP